MNSENRPYEPTSAERAQAHAKKAERKQMRPQNWRNWLDDEDEETLTPEKKDADENPITP